MTEIRNELAQNSRRRREKDKTKEEREKQYVNSRFLCHVARKCFCWFLQRDLMWHTDCDYDTQTRITQMLEPHNGSLALDGRGTDVQKKSYLSGDNIIISFCLSSPSVRCEQFLHWNLCIFLHLATSAQSPADIRKPSLRYDLDPCSFVSDFEMNGVSANVPRDAALTTKLFRCRRRWRSVSPSFLRLFVIIESSFTFIIDASQNRNEPPRSKEEIPKERKKNN